MCLEGKSVLVLGYGITGKALVDFLISRDIRVSVSDTGCFSDEDKAYFKKNNIEFEEGRHSRRFIEKSDILCPSPGIRVDDIPIGQKLVLSEIDIASFFFKGKIIAITGTNGKTTTTKIIDFVLNRAGYKSKAVGNIGLPFISVVGQSPDVAVVEVSSFQLFFSNYFAPDVAVILNISEDHMDWHKDFEEYVLAKKKIFEFMKEGVVLLNKNDPVASVLEVPDFLEKVFFPGGMRYDFDENWQAAVCVLSRLGVGKDIILDAYKEFRNPPHRMEFVMKKNGVVFIDDSKATNVHSTVWALKNVKGPVRLLCGGSFKGADFSAIVPFLTNVAKAYAFGQEAERINSALSGVIPVSVFMSMRGALLSAAKEAKGGDVVLLSPMCASFDEFKNYKERGDVFSKLVKEMV